MPPASPPATASPARARPAAAAVRLLGPHQLLRLLGKSARMMLWLGVDTRSDTDVMVALPRQQPPDPDALQAWLARARRTARLAHPRLARVLDVGVQERWPYVVYERGTRATWTERLAGKAQAASELAQWSVQALQGLAFAHDAGVVHGDLQPWSLLTDDLGNVSLLGLEIADGTLPRAAESDAGGHGAATDERRRQRQAAEVDLLSFGLLMHQSLAGSPALDEIDIGAAVGRLPPFGHDLVRLPWSVPLPVPDPLRAIVNRATDRQERQRYRNARTFERALAGWLEASADQDAGPISLLLGRMRTAGLLPAMPGGGQRATRLAQLEAGHATALSDAVLHDLALAFELVRQVNLAQARAGNAANGPVLAIHRAVAMLGLEGVRRAAQSLRPWPGPLNDEAATALDMQIRRVKRACAVARALQPAGYDPEVVTLVTALQNLGWLATQYHFPDEALQIRRLMQPAASPRPGEPDDPGMSAEAASFAVLGVDIETLGTAVMKHWGLDDGVAHMVRRAPADAPIHPPHGDDDLLRLVASCANELLEAQGQPSRQAAAALQRVVQRYARALGLSVKDFQAALAPPPLAEAAA